MRIGGAAIIIDDKKRILLLKRSHYSKAYPGFWTLPGGKNDGDENTPEEVVIREAKEESGLDFIPTELFQSAIMGNSGELVKTHRFLGEWSGTVNVASEETDGYAWYTYNETHSLKLAFDYHEVLEKLNTKGLI